MQGPTGSIGVHAFAYNLQSSGVLSPINISPQAHALGSLVSLMSMLNLEVALYFSNFLFNTIPESGISPDQIGALVFCGVCREGFEPATSCSIANSLNINKDAVKGEQRFFKQVLKLDKNFHVYIHGQRKFIEKGYDAARDMSFYKLFFRDEN